MVPPLQLNQRSFVVQPPSSTRSNHQTDNSALLAPKISVLPQSTHQNQVYTPQLSNYLTIIPNHITNSIYQPIHGQNHLSFAYPSHPSNNMIPSDDKPLKFHDILAKEERRSVFKPLTTV